MDTRTLTVLTVALLIVALVAMGGWKIITGRSQSDRATSVSEFESIRTGNLAEIERFLAEGGNPNTSIDFGRGPWPMLKIALFDREESIALALLDNGADFDASEVTLRNVAGEGMDRFLKRLLETDGGFGLEDVRTALASAAGNGYYEVVQLLVQNASTFEFAETEWERVLNRAAGIAIDRNADDTARLLYESSGDQTTPSLFNAARFSSPGLVRYLLSRGANPGEELSENGVSSGLTAMDLALSQLQRTHGRLADGIELNNHDIWLVIHELMQAGLEADLPVEDKEEIDRLITRWESIEKPSEKLVAASRFGYYDIVFDSLSDQNQIFGDDILRDALVTALRTDHDDIARLLVEAGAPVQGGPLHAAAGYSTPGFVRYLFRQGANPREIVDGLSPVEAWLEGGAVRLSLHELIRGGSDVCWLTEQLDHPKMHGFNQSILRNSATHCWE